MSIYCVHGSLHRKCVTCGYSEEVTELRARVADLKARLRAVRSLKYGPRSVATDLRVRNWRKP